MAEGLFVAYYRVSTAEQGRSGLGIEAQKETVARFLNGGNWKLIAEFEEHESGKRNNRPKLQEALDECKRTGATLVIARLDRLSRNSAFITALQESRTKFVCCDMPEANEFTITIMAALAAVEAKRISTNTKAALAAAKIRRAAANQPALGCAKGRCNVPVADRAKGTAKSAKVRAAAAAERHRLIVDRVKELRAEGLSLAAVAERLTAEHVRTPREGGTWHANGIKRILDRVPGDEGQFQIVIK